MFCTNGVKAVVDELIPQFERASGNKVVLQFEPSTQLSKRIDAGEPFDLVIMTTALVDEEIKAGKLSAESRTFIAKSGLGVSIRSGGKKPNIATVERFRRALLNAESITFAQQGASAQPFEVLVAKLGSRRSSGRNTTCATPLLKSARPSRAAPLNSGSRRSARSFPSAVSSWSVRFRKRSRVMWR